ncbi:SH3 domain-containing protein [Mariprofundus sp. KV]|uniref:SH3 domain-containing protein n=1 Tax=Mariprofundus sp. KV TaxID=2608715 RepID=UPI0015A15C15|nr:SH3 domain-containing protein [Mariprofundus sp. KV]NWF36063.1 SH3 domain-containing protein [Mariprofundus sp. KV]
MSVKQLSLCLVILALCSCAAVKKPLQPVLESRVNHIEIAKVETGKVLMIQQVNPVILAMGSSGLLLDTAIVAQRANEYKQSAGEVNQMATSVFEESLLKNLSKKGIKAKSQKKYYWDYYKGEQKEATKKIDAILRVELKNLGFWSKSILDPYMPSVFVLAELIDPATREVLYSDRFTMGIDITSLQVMKFLYGDINIVPNLRKTPSYDSFDKLLKNPEQSRKALLRTVAAAARHMAKGLNGESKTIMKTYAKSAAQVQVATSDDLIVDVKGARARSGPSTKSKILRKLKKGTIATKMQQQGEWLYVRLQDNGSSAWVHHSIFLKGQEVVTTN